MKAQRWSLQDAKNSFSAVVEAANQGRPQHVARRGKPVAVVLSAEEYDRLRQLDRNSATSFTELLLALPQDDLPLERAQVHPRDFAL
ncbi:MAG: type II toxin-antitoxin system Phd/YefM family antitoxin [Panacagrimonas sp.]